VSVFVIGAPRSGTSLLYKAVCLHPDAAWLSNWVRRAPNAPWIAGLNRLSRHAPVTRTAAWFGDGANAYVYNSRRYALQRMFPAPVEGEPVFARCGFDTFHPDGGVVDERRLRRTVRAVCRASGGSVFVSKRIANNRRVPQLAAALPDSKFVLMVRDGRAVALSLSRVDWWPSSPVWWYGGTPLQWAAEGRDPWELCARVWVEDTRAAEHGVAAIDPARVLTVRYEELVASPHAVLAEVADFVGLRRAPGWHESLRALSYPDRNERWRAELAPELCERITDWQRRDLHRWSYLDAVSA
jgi:hypothetical protein